MKPSHHHKMVFSLSSTVHYDEISNFSFVSSLRYANTLWQSCLLHLVKTFWKQTRRWTLVITLGFNHSPLVTLTPSHHQVLILVVDDDTESRIAAVDDTTVSLFGYANETELLNTKLSSIVPAPYREQHRLYAENYLATGIKPLGIKLVTHKSKGDTVYPCSYLYFITWAEGMVVEGLTKSNEPIPLLCSWADITTIKGLNEDSLSSSPSTGAIQAFPEATQPAKYFTNMHIKTE